MQHKHQACAAYFLMIQTHFPIMDLTEKVKIFKDYLLSSPQIT